MSTRQPRKAPPQRVPLKDYKDTKKLSYQLSSVLGKGAFATVYKCQSIEDHHTYACKVVNKKLLKNPQHFKKLRSEIKLHLAMQHKNIIQMYKHFVDGNWVYMVLELCSNGSLMDIIRRRHKITEPEAALWFKQIVQTVKYLHGQRVIHRDLKLGNILLDNHMNIKLCDFGLAAKLDYDNQRRTTFCGTPNYIAPEILSRNKGHSYEVDIWSLGVLLYSMLCGKPPFETNNVKETYARIKQLKYRFPYNVRLSQSCRHMIQSILVSEPSQRLTLDFMLVHAFLNGEHPIPVCIPNTARFAIPSKEQLFPKYAAYKENNSEATAKANANLHAIISNTNANVGCERYGAKAGCGTNGERFEKNGERYEKNGERYEKNAKCEKYEANECKSYEPMINNENMTSKTIADKNSTNFILYIIDWIDYRKRYGLGYIFSNGSTGIYFNDCTKILSSTESVLYVNNDGKCVTFDKNEYPPYLMKKMTLLMHFESYLQSKLNVEQKESIKNYQLLHSERVRDGVYLEMLMSTEHAKLFLLSNKTIQIDFNDGSRIITCSKTQLVVYTNKEQTQQILLLSDALNTKQRDLKKRMQYMQDVLRQMWDN